MRVGWGGCASTWSLSLTNMTAVGEYCELGRWEMLVTGGGRYKAFCLATMNVWGG